MRKKDAGSYNFTDYAFAKAITKDFPTIIRALNKAIMDLREYHHYRGVWNVIQTIEDNKMAMQMQYDYYKDIYKKKGRVDE